MKNVHKVIRYRDLLLCSYDLVLDPLKLHFQFPTLHAIFFIRKFFQDEDQSQIFMIEMQLSGRESNKTTTNQTKQQT